MSSNNISEDKKLLQNPTIFLGKKSEIIEKCKSCRKNINLIKCIKCSNYFCFDCIKNIFKLTLIGIKSNFLAANLKGRSNCETGATKSDISTTIPWCLSTLRSVSKHSAMFVLVCLGSKATSSRIRRKICRLPFLGGTYNST